MPDFTADELASVGYKAAAPAAPQFSVEDLASVGYAPPHPVSQTPFTDVATGLVGGIAGEASDLLGRGIKNVGQVVGSQGLQDYGQSRIDNAEFLKGVGNQSSQTATTVGKVGADVVAAAVAPGGVLGGGALAGLATSEADNPAGVLVDVAKSAALSAALGKAITVGGKYVAEGVKKMAAPLANIVKGTSIVKTSVDDYTNGAIDAIIKRSNGDISKATPDEAVASIQSVEKGLKEQANSLYTLRNEAAAKAGITVEKSKVSSLLDDLKASKISGEEEGVDDAISAATRIIGTGGAPSSFTKAEALLSGLNARIADEGVKGNSVIVRSLEKVRSAFTDDIAKASAANPEVMQLHDAARAFYKDSYIPIAKLDTKNQVMNKVTERQFISQLVNRLDKNSTATSGFTALPQQVKSQILGAWLQIKQNAATKTGEMDLNALSKSIQKARVDNPSLFKLTNALDDMETLANVLAAKGDLKIKVRSAFNPTTVGFTGLGALGGGLAGAATGFAGSVAIPIAMHLYSAGKLLNNKAAQDLLKTMRGLETYPDSAMAKMASDKITKLYSNQFKNISTKALSIMMGSNSI